MSGLEGLEGLSGREQLLAVKGFYASLPEDYRLPITAAQLFELLQVAYSHGYVDATDVLPPEGMNPYELEKK